VFHQGDGLLSGRRAGGAPRIIGAQQLHQGCRQLLGSPPGSLGFEGVPVPLCNRQLAVKSFRVGQSLIGPAAVCCPGLA
jgi:hypothetical protein